MANRRGKFDVKTALQKIFEDVENLNERYVLSFELQ